MNMHIFVSDLEDAAASIGSAPLYLKWKQYRLVHKNDEELLEYQESEHLRLYQLSNIESLQLLFDNDDYHLLERIDAALKILKPFWKAHLNLG